MKSLRVLGIMSGTSLDGVDGALCNCTSTQVRLIAQFSSRFPPSLRQRLSAAARGDSNSWETAQLHHDLGRFYATIAGKWLKGRSVDAIGLHGQTIFHRPHIKTPATLQMGEPTYLAEQLRVPIVSDFRVADLAAGGQGAPLATLFHQVAFARRGECIAVNNLGGISNVTWIDWTNAARSPRIMAFDTGPGNILVDAAVSQMTNARRRYDRNGSMGRQGKIDQVQLRAWLRHPYFRLAPPKSTGRELFGEAFLSKAMAGAESVPSADLLATLTELTAASIALNYRSHLPRLPQRVILCGGGAENGFLRERIQHHLADETTVETSNDHGWPTSMVEPSAFALLAAYRIWGRAGNLPITTGASRPVLLGKIVEVEAC